MNRYVCAITPYLHRSEWGFGKALHEQGLKDTRSSYRIAWGVGHPRWIVDAEFKEDLRLNCTRCGFLKVSSLTSDDQSDTVI